MTSRLARAIGQVRDLLRKACAEDPLTHPHRTVDEGVAAIRGPDGGLSGGRIFTRRG
jgi:hypothetical protein